MLSTIDIPIAFRAGIRTLAIIFLTGMPWLSAAPTAVEPLIRINQIGYLPDGNKVAVIADPQSGPNAGDSFTPGGTYEVRRWDDDSQVFSGSPQAWNGGATHAQSGDRGWWFDFSAVTTPGSYYLWDVDNSVRSHRFEIGDTVYDPILVQAIRIFFYQRCGFAKEAIHAGADWTDGAAFLGPGQDGECRSVYGQGDPGSARDLRGGWMDAGDYNKYVTFAEPVVHQLLNAWEERPEAFNDNLDIPESGNGLPDILDEVHFEMKWMARMQEPDGGVILKMGETDHNGSSPPSSDGRPRYYVPVCSSSTIAASGMYAHAALVFRNIPRWKVFADELEQRAIDAWDHYHANPKSENCDDGTVKAGDADRNLARQHESAVTAAIYLHRLTGDSTYGDFVEAHYLDTNPFTWGGFSVYQPYLAEALLHYMLTPQAPESVASTIRQRKLSNENGSVINWTDSDLYRGYMPDDQYHWGSNSIRSNFANASLDYAAFHLTEADLAERRLRAENLLHNLLGLNPLGLVYLSNMGSFGAEKSVTQIYHTWFNHGTQWDSNPPPGYLPGGPNKNYGGSLSELQGLPPQKSYLDFNTGWPENSWEISEPGIYYQSAFIKMLSKFVSPQTTTADLDDSDRDGLAACFEDWFGLDKDRHDSLKDKVTFDTSSETPHVIVKRNLNASPFDVLPQWSVNLVQWTDLPPRQAEVVGQDCSSIHLSYPIANPGDKTVFIRFRHNEEFTTPLEL